jgi:regulator of sigma D
VKLYVYVSRQLADDAAKTAIINEFRRDMLNNSRQIMDFLRTYSAVRLDDSFADTFQIELLVIGAALVQRIEREQTSLFPLYQASY